MELKKLKTERAGNILLLRTVRLRVERQTEVDRYESFTSNRYVETQGRI